MLIQNAPRVSLFGFRSEIWSAWELCAAKQPFSATTKPLQRRTISSSVLAWRWERGSWGAMEKIELGKGKIGGSRGGRKSATFATLAWHSCEEGRRARVWLHHWLAWGPFLADWTNLIYQVTTFVGFPSRFRRPSAWPVWPCPFLLHPSGALVRRMWLTYSHPQLLTSRTRLSFSLSWVLPILLEMKMNTEFAVWRILNM